MNKSITVILTTLLLMASGQSAYAQLNPATAQIRSIPVKDGIYMFMGAGGNLAVSTGADGVLIVDDDFAQRADQGRVFATRLFLELSE